LQGIIFVTGTDTGVGKTILTAFLLYHLRRTGIHALAMKPFCSGSRGDVKLFQALQNSELADEEINPYYFSKPVAPIVAVRASDRTFTLTQVVRRIRSVARKCECLLVEGIGGLLVPLSDRFMVIDLIHCLSPNVFLVARNRLGTINHTLLSARALRMIGVRRFKGVLVDVARPDTSSRTNQAILREFLRPNPVFALPHLSKNSGRPGAIKKNYDRVKKLLARLCA
jgi:dethiobiotin synthetase